MGLKSIGEPAASRLKIADLEVSIRMSTVGQKQTFSDVQAMSALPPKADIGRVGGHVRFVPIADINWSPAHHLS
jgi:hypothetical protein